MQRKTSAKNRTMREKTVSTSGISAFICVTVLGACLFALFSVSVAQAKQRVKLFDITFPQPKKGQMDRLADLRIRGKRVAPPVFASADIVFYLDKKGRVDSIGWQDKPEDSLIFRPYQDSLLATGFYPGEAHGKKSAFALAARVYTLGDRLGARAVVQLPVDEKGALIDYSLALKSLEKLGYQAPELLQFPSYFYRKLDPTNNKERLYQFAIIKVELDSAGTPYNREIYFSTDSELGEMILLASGWADYAPATLNSRNIPAVGFVFVRFFREVAYPVEPWTPERDSSERTLEQLRVSWIPGELLPDVAPVQKGNQDMQITLPLTFSRNTTKEAQLRIDAHGRATVANPTGVTGNVDRQLLLDKLKSIPFYPGFRVAPDSTSGSLRINWLSVLGKLELLPIDSTVYRLETEFIDRYSTVDSR